jgi:hypothetical protein
LFLLKFVNDSCFRGCPNRTVVFLEKRRVFGNGLVRPCRNLARASQARRASRSLYRNSRGFRQSLAACGSGILQLRHSACGRDLRLRLLDRNAAVGNGDRDAEPLDAHADDTVVAHIFSAKRLKQAPMKRNR